MPATCSNISAHRIFGACAASSMSCHLTGGLFLMATLAVIGVPPFSIFQSEFITLSAALATHHSWLAFLFIAGLVTIFVGFLTHMVRMNLGEPHSDKFNAPTSQRYDECPWKFWRDVICRDSDSWCSAFGCRSRFISGATNRSNSRRLSMNVSNRLAPNSRRLAESI